MSDVNVARYRAEPANDCSCGQIHGYRVVGPGMRTHKLTERLAAEKGAELLNEGKITAAELGVLWGIADADIALSAAKAQLAAIVFN